MGNAWGRLFALEIVVLFVVATLPAPVAADWSCDPQPCVAWETIYHPAADVDEVHHAAVALSPDGTLLFTAGEAFDVDFGPSEVVAAAFDTETGDVAWGTTYTPGWEGEHGVEHAALSPDGSVFYVAGLSTQADDASYWDIIALAFDTADGSLLWDYRYANPVPESKETVYSMALAPDGSQLFLAGKTRWTQDEGTQQEFLVVALDAATGGVEWTYRTKPTAEDFSVAYDVVVAPDGSAVYASGYAYRGFIEGIAAGLDAADGGELWLRELGRPDAHTTWGKEIGIHPDGSMLYVAGPHSPGVGTGSIGLWVVDSATGSIEVFEDMASVADAAEAFELIVSPVGDRVFVVGRIPGEDVISDGYDGLVLQYDAETGELGWHDRFVSPYGEQDVHAFGQMDSSGERLYVGTVATDGQCCAGDGRGWVHLYWAENGAKLYTLEGNGPDWFWGGMLLGPSEDRLYIAGDTIETDDGSVDLFVRGVRIDPTVDCAANTPAGHPDWDGDGLADMCDPDDDGDGRPDGSDAFPFDATETDDSDGDGVGDNADGDDDYDGVPDDLEARTYDTSLGLFDIGVAAVGAVPGSPVWGASADGPVSVIVRELPGVPEPTTVRVYVISTDGDYFESRWTLYHEATTNGGENHVARITDDVLDIVDEFPSGGLTRSSLPFYVKVVALVPEAGWVTQWYGPGGDVKTPIVIDITLP